VSKQEEIDLRHQMQEYLDMGEGLTQDDKENLWILARQIQRLDTANNATLKTQLEKHGQWLKDVSTDK